MVRAPRPTGLGQAARLTGAACDQLPARRLDRRYLPTLRARGGLQSYPSRIKDPDTVDYSTGSVGIGATAPSGARWRTATWPGISTVPPAAVMPARRRRARRRRDLGGGRGPGGRRTGRTAVGRRPQPAVAGPGGARHPAPASGDVRSSRLALRVVKCGPRLRSGGAESCAALDACPTRSTSGCCARRRVRDARARSEVDAAGLDDARAAGHVPRPRRSRPRLAGRHLPQADSDGPTDGDIRLHDQGPGAAHRGTSRTTTPPCSTTSRCASSPRRRDRPRRPWAPFETAPRGRAVRGRRRERLRREEPSSSADAARRPRRPGPRAQGPISTQQALGRFLADLTREAPEVADARGDLVARRRTSTNLGGWINKTGHLVDRRPNRLVRR